MALKYYHANPKVYFAKDVNRNAGFRGIYAVTAENKKEAKALMEVEINKRYKKYEKKIDYGPLWDIELHKFINRIANREAMKSPLVKGVWYANKIFFKREKKK